MSGTVGRRREDFVKYSFDFDGTNEFFSGTTNYTSTDGQTKLTLSIWIKPVSGAPLLEYILSNPNT